MNKQAPFNYKQNEYLDRTTISWFNVAEGGKRGGKNVLQTMAFCIALENHPNKIHLIAGVSSATAKLNILDCDGFGLLNFYKGRCREGKYKDRDCLYITTPTGEKVVLVSGGGKKGDEKLIKGNTYGMAYVTEANECSEIFLKEVFDRTVSSDNRKVFHDLNPKSESHWYYEQILDFHQEKQKEDCDYGYNYGHFTIADNMSISDEKMKKVLSTYKKDTVWYLRDMKGLRKQAEGAIYPMFTVNKDKYVISELSDIGVKVTDIIHINLGVDFGGNKSASKFTATGFTKGYQKVIVLDEEHRPAATEDPEKLANAYVGFCKRVKSKYKNVFFSYQDSAEQILIRGLNLASVRADLGIKTLNAIKGEIVGRIRLVTSLFAQNRLYIMDYCETLIKALDTAVYDEKGVTEDIRLDNGSYDVDSLDSFEYTLEPVAKKLQVLGVIN